MKPDPGSVFLAAKVERHGVADFDCSFDGEEAMCGIRSYVAGKVGSDRETDEVGVCHRVWSLFGMLVRR